MAAGRALPGAVDVPAPTAIRVLKSRTRRTCARTTVKPGALFLAGEPLDEPTARWISEALGGPVIDNYWQTESGWPILSVANGVERDDAQVRQPGRRHARL